MRKHTGILAWSGVVLGFALATGCSNPPQRPPEEVDPFFGPDAPTQPKKVGPATPAGPEARLNTPLPLTQQTSSTAAMASGAPLKGGREPIGIPVSDGASGKKAWLENDGAKTALKPPQPITQGQGLPPVPNVPYEISPELQAQLKKRHVVYQNQEPVAGGVHFVCIVENPNNPSSLPKYEVVAADVETAVRAVLDKIDQAR